MTGIIFRDLELENFSILKFYVACANRIVPALAVLCFLSDIICLKESGYFDAASHEKWLLHTWSLSVEWQFYLIYPVLSLSFYTTRKTKKVIEWGGFALVFTSYFQKLTLDLDT